MSRSDEGRNGRQKAVHQGLPSIGDPDSPSPLSPVDDPGPVDPDPVDPGPVDPGPVEEQPARNDAGDDTLTVGQLCRRFEAGVKQAFPDEVWVQGAISGLTRSNNGHVYFDLIDPSDEVGRATDAVLPVALFAKHRHLVNRILRKAGGVRMHDGIEIRIRGRVAYYPPQSRIQLLMSLIDPAFTLGQMVAAKTELLDRLREQDLLERNQRVAFPVLPLRVALITSGGSAAFADFVNEIELSGHPFAITLLDSRVQGLESVPGLSEAVAAADGLDVDVVVLIRGGGSRTDLVAFDHEKVATAIAHCRHPVVVGVGHETDRSVADEVANRSAKTPTACAAMLVEAVSTYSRRLESSAVRLGSLTTLHLGSARERLYGCGARLAGVGARAVERQRMELGHVGHRLSRAPGRELERSEQHLATASARLAAYDPRSALRRGWTITHTESGELVRSIERLSVGTRLRTTTMDGTITSEVVETERGSDQMDSQIDQNEQP